jgi:hypothetical protein
MRKITNLQVSKYHMQQFKHILDSQHIHIQENVEENVKN